MKFKSDIEVQAGLKDSSGAAGTSGQVLSSNGTTVSWINSDIGVASDVQNQVKAGVAINKGQAVYVTSADGTNIIVGLASNTSEATSSKTLGLLNATVAANGFADVVQIGRLSGLNTIGAVVGDPVWLGTNGNLIYGLANKPYAPAHLVYIGVVTRVNANNGEIFITVQNGFELQELHNVDIITTTPANGDVLGYNGTLWVNKTVPGWLGYTPVTDARTLTINGTAYDLTANRSWSVGTVTSVAALTIGTSGTDLSSSVATGTTTPVITLNVPTASALNRGALSSTDWNTFNSKQDAITLTTTGTGAATLIANVLNIPTPSIPASIMVVGTGTCSTIRDGVGNTSAGARAAALGGISNTASAAYSTVVGGQNNTASCHWSFVGGGYTNTASAIYSTVVGGIFNAASGINSFVGGGYSSLASGTRSFVGGGYGNVASGPQSFVGGGTGNVASSIFSFVGGGLQNTASGTLSFVGGGGNNTASDGCSFVGGGFNNTAICQYSSVGGGYNNTASAAYSTVVGGGFNTASGTSSFVGGGSYHTASGGGSFVGGGDNNTASSGWSSVGGGLSNVASGSFSSVGGGVNNTAIGNCSFVGGGRDNQVNSTCSSILGGFGNYIPAYAYNSHIIGSLQYASASNTTFTQALSKTSGTFRISHPDPSKNQTHYLQHSFVESPTRGDNIYRFTVTTVNSVGTIKLPDYYKFLNEDDQVFVTAKNSFGIAYGVVNEEQTGITVTSNIDGEYNVLLIATRKDIDALNGWRGVEVWK